MKNFALKIALTETPSGNQLFIQTKKIINRKKVSDKFKEANDAFWNLCVQGANTDKSNKDYSWRKAVYKEVKALPKYRRIVIDAAHGNDTKLKHFISRCKFRDFKGAFELV